MYIHCNICLGTPLLIIRGGTVCMTCSTFLMHYMKMYILCHIFTSLHFSSIKCSAPVLYEGHIVLPVTVQIEIYVLDGFFCLFVCFECDALLEFEAVCTVVSLYTYNFSFTLVLSAVSARHDVGAVNVQYWKVTEKHGSSSNNLELSGSICQISYRSVKVTKIIICIKIQSP